MNNALQKPVFSSSVFKPDARKYLIAAQICAAIFPFIIAAADFSVETCGYIGTSSTADAINAVDVAPG